MNRDCDVLVVGAGPAGSTAALSIKQKLPELRVVLVDKSSFPRDKACGDGVSPGALAVAERLGVATKLVSNFHHVDECILYGSDRGAVMTAIPEVGYPSKFGLVAKRIDFDNELLDAAIKCGVEFVADARFTATELTDDKSKRVAHFETSLEPISISTRLLVGADGANSRVRKSFHQGRNSDKTTSIAIRCYVDVLSFPDSCSNRLRFEFNENLCPGYGWLFPTSDRGANLGVGMSVDEFKRRHIDLKELLSQYRITLENRGFVFGEQTDFATYTLPHGGHLPKMIHSRGVLIGDAASMINPLSGEGIFYGMAAGEMLAQQLTDDLQPRELASFKRIFNKRFRRHYWNNYLAMRALKSWKITRRALNAVHDDRDALDTAASIMFGEGRLGFKTAIKLGWHALVS